MYSRVEDAKHRSGAARLRNFIVRPTGTVASRPGFQYVGTVKDSALAVRLLKFRVSNTRTIVLEVGDGYFRFYENGARVELSTPPADYIPNRTFVEAAVDVGTNELTIPSARSACCPSSPSSCLASSASPTSTRCSRR